MEHYTTTVLSIMLKNERDWRKRYNIYKVIYRIINNN